MPANLEPLPTYDMAPETPSLPHNAGPNPVVQSPQGVLAYADPSTPAREPLAFPGNSRFRDLWLPVGVLGIGAMLLMSVIVAVVIGGRPAGRLLSNIGLRLAWDVAMTFLTGWMLSGILDIYLGQLHIALLKLAAIAVGRFALWAVIGIPVVNIIGDFAGFALALPLFVWLLFYLFELDFRETAIAAIFLTSVRWISYFGLWKLL